MLKLLFRRPDLELVGVHAVGEQATELVHVGLMAMISNATAHVFDEACFNLPTLGQLYSVLSVGLRKEGKPPYFWEESHRIRRTEVRPTRSRRATSALATPARCSLWISAA